MKVWVSTRTLMHAFPAGWFWTEIFEFRSSASKSFWISRSVSGEKASGAIQIFPMPEPRMCLRDLWTGGVAMTSLTAGLPARAMMTSSPLSTAAMSLEKMSFGVMDVYFHVSYIS